MKTLLLVVSVALSIAFSLNAGVALAQHEGMKGHDSMDGGHANMPAGDKPTPEKNKTCCGDKKKMGNMDMKQQPKPPEQKE